MWRRRIVAGQDVRMPETDGIRATERILATLEDPPRIVVVTTFENDAYACEALHAGAAGFLLKRATAEELVQEADVLRLMAAGLTGAEIAGRLPVGPATVKTHVAAVLAETGARDRTQAVIAAYEAGWSPRAEPPAGLRARPAT